ncbi:MAG: O-acetyl-ADP-ribose deacetylase [Bacteroidales bacterium]|nr:O-acetyl-ADP-ribose deacetylase [Bacteroidales bacterium]MCF8328049.1 O-acetyl-ADP-ribose deacetylase [Bacteroidales bacterium]
MDRIELTQEDITKMEVDAIVNAANKTLLGGGGVDGAIHRAAGPYLKKECETLEGAETGEAKLTKGHQLPASFIIHTVGPVWNGGKNNEEKLLADAYRNSLEIAKMNEFETIAFPNISTGVYHFPKDKAADIAIETVKEFLTNNKFPMKVYFVCFDDENYSIYKSKLEQ